jgi:hypothetical protein
MEILPRYLYIIYLESVCWVLENTYLLGVPREIFD